MFEVFIALFGGVYSVAKILADRSDMKSNIFDSDCRSRRWESRLQAWRARVEDRALEEDLWDYITKYENRKDVWAETLGFYMGTCLHKVYDSADDWVHDGVMDNTKAGREMYRKRRFYEPLDIMLAKRGKLRSVFISNPVAYLVPGEGQRTRNEWDKTLEFWLHIQDELRGNGVSAQLLFGPQNMYEHPYRGYFNADEVEKFRYRSGCLVWLPTTWVGTNLAPL